MSHEIAVHTTASMLAIRPAQTGFTPDQIEVLRHLGAPGATPEEFDLFFHACQATHLDPFTGQIHLLPTRVLVDGEAWETRHRAVTGIQGYRTIGERQAAQNGDTLTEEKPAWCGPDGDWVRAWASKEPPAAAEHVIVKNGHPITGTALYLECVKTDAEGAPVDYWARRPASQLLIRAEVAAWRKAYPDQTAGVQLDDAVVIEPDGSPSPARKRARSERVQPTAAAVLSGRRDTKPPRRRGRRATTTKGTDQ